MNVAQHSPGYAAPGGPARSPNANRDPPGRPECPRVAGVRADYRADREPHAARAGREAVRVAEHPARVRAHRADAAPMAALVRLQLDELARPRNVPAAQAPAEAHARAGADRALRGSQRHARLDID